MTTDLDIYNPTKVRGIVESLERDLSALRKENEALKEDAERLDWLIQQAYSGLNEELREPHAVGLVIGGKVEWPDGVRAAIDAAISKELV